MNLYLITPTSICSYASAGTLAASAAKCVRTSQITTMTNYCKCFRRRVIVDKPSLNRWNQKFTKSFCPQRRSDQGGVGRPIKIARVADLRRSYPSLSWLQHGQSEFFPAARQQLSYHVLQTSRRRKTVLIRYLSELLHKYRGTYSV